MFSTFADVFGSDDSNTKNINGSNNPFDSSSSSTTTTAATATTVDAFGVSSDMKLSASSQGFDDSPFIVETSPFTDDFNRLRTRNSPNELTLDPLDDLPMKSTSLTINNNSNLPHSKSINLINPFSVPTLSNDTSIVSIQASPIDLLFDPNIDPSTLPSNTENSSLVHSDQVQSSYDLLGLNKQSKPTAATTTIKILKSDSLTDLPKLNQTKKSSPSNSLTTKSNIPTATSFHSMPINALSTSPSALRVQATALSILTGSTTSNTPFDDQYLDWLTQSDDLMCGVDPKLTGPSKKIDINMLKSTEDLLGSIYRQPNGSQTLTTLQETSHETTPLPTKTLIRRPSTEDVPSIQIHEPTSEHNDSNIVPQGYFDQKKSKNDSDESEDEKMVFKIGEKKTTSSDQHANVPVPLLPPPPSSPSTSKKYTGASDDAGSSSSGEDDNDDPLAVFRSKSIKDKSKPTTGTNLITDWDEPEESPIAQEEYKVYLMLLSFVSSRLVLCH